MFVITKSKHDVFWRYGCCTIGTATPRLDSEVPRRRRGAKVSVAQARYGGGRSSILQEEVGAASPDVAYRSCSSLVQGKSDQHG
jgi:hypothetical protein